MRSVKWLRLQATLVALVAGAVMLIGSPAQAATGTHSASTQKTVTHKAVAKASVHPRMSLRTPAPQATGPNEISEGGCGFLQRCIYLSRSEQLVILAGGSATVVVLLCSVTAIIGCALATGLVAAAYQWLSSRGGACPISKPKLRVQYIPWPQVEGCVA